MCQYQERKCLYSFCYTYDAWGKPVFTEGSMAGTLGKDNPFRYRGYVWDEETGLYATATRYYSPEWGRWLITDNYNIINGDNDHILENNLFAYCFNNPATLEDSYGTWPRWVTQLVVSVVVVAIVVVVAAVIVSTAGTGTAAAVVAVSAAKGAAIGMASGAAMGAVTGAVGHSLSTGDWSGAGDAALDGMGAGALSGAITGAVIGAANGAISVGQAAKSWSSGGTYKNGYQSMTNHYQRQVIEKGFSKGNSVLKYTDDALEFARRNKCVMRYVKPSRSTMLPGWRSPYTHGAGGWFTSKSKILTFWYK